MPVSQIAMTQSYCRLFLATPVDSSADALLPVLGSAIKGGDIASLLIRHNDKSVLTKLANLLTGPAQAADIAVIIDRDVELTVQCGADGVQVGPDIEDYNKARQILGDDRIVGADCGQSRHRAMELAEAGADYVGFDWQGGALPGDQVAVWWAETFEVPCVVTTGLDEARAGVAIGQLVDFIRPEDGMWQDKQRAEAAVKTYNKLIEDTVIETG